MVKQGSKPFKKRGIQAFDDDFDLEGNIKVTLT